MNIYIYKALLFLYLLSLGDLSAQILADNFSFENRIYKENIHTVILGRKGASLTEPIMALKSDDKLQLTFDEIAENTKEYYYSVVHCTANWEASDLMFNEFAEGYQSVPIEDFEFSFNTTISYCNYRIAFPNNDLKLKLSGNYILYVFEDNDTEKVVLTKRFRVVEELVAIEADIKRATLPQYKETKQEVDIKVNISALQITDPYSEVLLYVSQNNNPNKTLQIKPKYASYNSIDYNYEEENLFDGINEFRHFDVTNIKFTEMETEDVFYDEPFYHFILRADEVASIAYSYERDLNGRFKIHETNSVESVINADYVVVHFVMPFSLPLAGKVYICGGFTDWQLLPKYEIKYDLEKKTYITSLLLKQGYYDYRYIFVPSGKTEAEEGYIEGNFSDTENDYTIYVYLRAHSAQYDRLIGVKTYNSMKTY